MSITDQITRLQTAKNDIKTSIQNKGVTVADDAKIDTYSALIDSIQAGSSEPTTEYVNPDFYNIRTNSGTDYRYLFYEFNNQLKNQDAYEKGLDLSNWDISKVIYFMYMFHSTYVKKIDLTGWATMVNRREPWNFMQNLFHSFGGEEIDLTGWNTYGVTMFDWFYSCSSLKKIYGEFDLSNLQSGYLNEMSLILTSSKMFHGCKNLEYVKLKNIYANAEMTNSDKWSIHCFYNSKLSDECLIDIINELPDLYNDKGLTETDQLIFALPTTNTLTADQVSIAVYKGWTVTNTTY